MRFSIPKLVSEIFQNINQVVYKKYQFYKFRVSNGQIVSSSKSQISSTAIVGERTTLQPNVVLGNHVVIGKHCII